MAQYGSVKCSKQNIDCISDMSLTQARLCWGTITPVHPTKDSPQNMNNFWLPIQQNLCIALSIWCHHTKKDQILVWFLPAVCFANMSWLIPGIPPFEAFHFHPCKRLLCKFFAILFVHLHMSAYQDALLRQSFLSPESEQIFYPMILPQTSLLEFEYGNILRHLIHSRVE